MNGLSKILAAVSIVSAPLVLWGTSALAQQSDSLPYYGAVEASSANQRMQLEQQPVHMRINAGPLQIGAPQVFFEMNGGFSPVRFGSSSDFHFLGRSPGEGVDPASMFKLYKAEVRRKKQRRIKASHSSFTQGMTLQLDRELVPTRFETAKNGLVRIYPLQPLPAGEYAFITINRAYAFGVD